MHSTRSGQPLCKILFSLFMLMIVLTYTGGNTGKAAEPEQDQKKPYVNERDEWFYSQRMGKQGGSFHDAYQAAQNQANTLKGSAQRIRRNAAAQTSANQWVNIGPGPVHNEYWTQGDVSGRISNITAGSDGTLYLAAAGGGVWSSKDDGASWLPLTDSQPSLVMGALAVDPTDPKVIYAGTGEFHNSGDSLFGTGILKTTDGGTHWSVLGHSIFKGARISSILIDPAHTTTLYVASDRGLFKSTDGGSTFIESVVVDPSRNNGVDSIVMDPKNPSVLYAALTLNGIYKSTDGGGTWQELTDGISIPKEHFGTAYLAIAPSNSDILYVSIADYWQGNLAGLFATKNGGSSWSELKNTPDYLDSDFYYGTRTNESPSNQVDRGGSEGDEEDFGQGFYDNVLAVSPDDPNVVYAGGIGIAKTIDGGQTWTSDIAMSQHIHPDQHALFFHPLTGDLYIGNDGGIFKIAHDGTSKNLNTNLSIMQFYPGMSVSGNGTQIIAGAQDNGTNKYAGTVDWQNVISGDGGMTAVNPENADQYIIEFPHGELGITLDGGKNFYYYSMSPFFTDANWIAPYVVPQGGRFGSVMYFGGDNVYKTEDGGNSWRKLTQNTTLNNNVSALTIAPSNPSVIYAGWNDGTLRITSDGGETWREIPTGYDNWITSIAVSPTNPYEVYVTLSGYYFPDYNGFPAHVLKSANANQPAPAWDNLTSNLPKAPVNKIIVDGATLLVGTDVGVFASVNNGQSWSAYGEGLPNVVITDLVKSQDGKLFASSYGRGMWMVTPNTPVLSVTAVNKVSPNGGAFRGGQEVIITGAGFSHATEVKFGNLPAIRFTVDSDTQITAITPAITGSGPRAVDVNVTAKGGVSAKNALDIFTYYQDDTSPTIVGVNPANLATVYTSMPTISAVLNDAESGIDPGTIAIKLNGVSVPFLFNPEYMTVTAATYHLPNDTYHLTIDVSDKAGNLAQQSSSTFNVSVDQSAGKIGYLALGDSLAAGLTPYKSLSTGYTDMLAENIHNAGYLGEFVKNYAIPGYTTQNVLDVILNNVKDPNGLTIQQNIANAGVITLDAGANDFLQNLNPDFSMDQDKILGLLSQIGTNTSSIISEIRKQNPNVKIYIMGYYDAFHNFPLSDIQKQLLTAALDMLNDTLAYTAQQSGAIFVPTKEAIAKDYQNNLPNPTDIHPSIQGYKVIASVMWNVMQSQFAWPQGSSLTATGVTSTSLTLNWTPANGEVTDYKIYKGTNELGTVTGSVYAYHVTALTPDTTYNFKVEAKLPNGTWTTNGPAAVQKTAPAPDTTAPVIGSVSPANGATVTTATPVISARFMETGSGINQASIVVKVDNKALHYSYDAANLTVTTSTYSFTNGSHSLTIDVSDFAGNHAVQWNSSFTVNLGNTDYGSVWPQGSSLTATNVTPTGLTLNWTPANGGVTDYKIYKGTNELGTVTGNVYVYNVTALTPDTTYAFKVEAKLPNGTWTTDGPFVTQKTAATDATAPVIGSVSPAIGVTVTTASPIISAAFTETGSGINSASIVVKVDNQTLLYSYDAANMTVTASTYSLINGSHSLTIDVMDLTGNHAVQWNSSFTVNVNSSSGYFGGSSPIPSVNQLSTNELNDLIKQSGASANTIIDLNKNNYILLPANAGELLLQAQKRAVITSNGNSIEIPSSVLITLSKLLSGDEAKDAQIRVSLKAIESSDSNALLDAANQASGAWIKQNGILYEFDLTIENKDGKSSRLDSFNEPVTLRFKLDSNGTDSTLLGIYYLNESLKQWEYIGGGINAANGTIEAALSHNSKYAVLEYNKTYMDVPSTHWAYQTIRVLSAKHVIEGVTSQEFGPAQPTTRAQFVTLLVRALGIQNTSVQSTFIDVAEGQWYSEAIAAAVHAGIVKGMDDTHFAPNATITREQMAVLLVRAYEFKKGVLLKSSDKLANYEDAPKVSSWANEEVNKAVNAGFMQGRDKGRFVPEATTTRAETAKAIYNLLDK